VITLDLPQLDGPSQLEVWSSDQPVTVHRANEFSAAMSRDILAISICLDEEAGGGLTKTTQQAYQLLLAQLRELGFPYLWRIWNYFPRINEQERGLERYKQFCVGRYQALAEILSDFPASLPASTAVGTRSGPLRVYVLAGAQPATHLSNPRQVNSYEYPDTYGPCRPYFARATICRSESGSQLFIAGTASVVGHASQHAGLPGEQAREILHNLRTLLDHADRHLDGLGTASTHAGLYKVYVRNPLHLSSIRATLRDRLLDSSRLLFLQGDLCRQELLVEIEGRISTD
jgi:chorismate lyase/3-hydroxybenzoate synthase